jgi:3-hydroxybutyryl-CoA dehydrogenase
MSEVEIRTVAVVGAGVLGRELAAGALLAGYRVVLEDVLPVNLRNARAQIELQIQSAASLKDIAQIDYVSTVEDAVREADLAIDFVPDELESKLEIFCLMDRMAPPKTILCTPAIRVGIADISSCTYRAPRCMAVQPGEQGSGLPGKSVRLLRTAATPDDVAEAVRKFWLSLDCEVTSMDIATS